MRKLIGCDLIEYAYPSDGGGNLLAVDEEGKLLGKGINEKASILYGYFPLGFFIVGDALYLSKNEAPL